MTAMVKATPITREQWLNECADLILDEIIRPVWNVRPDLKVKVSVGFAPNTRTGSKVIGVCLASKCSESKYNEIFIVPTINDSLRVLDVLVHELIHAVLDNQHGHRGPFVEIMHKVGLIGVPTSTDAGPKLLKQLQTYVDLLGHIPHARVNLASQKRQTNRQLLVYCQDAECDFKFNTSRKQIDKVLDMHGEISCCVCGKAMATP